MGVCKFEKNGACALAEAIEVYRGVSAIATGFLTDANLELAERAQNIMNMAGRDSDSTAMPTGAGSIATPQKGATWYYPCLVNRGATNCDSQIK